MARRAGLRGTQAFHISKCGAARWKGKRLRYDIGMPGDGTWQGLVAVVRLRGLEATWQGWWPEEYTGKADIS